MPALLIRGRTVVNHDDSRPADVLVDRGTIAAIGSRLDAPTGAEVAAPCRHRRHSRQSSAGAVKTAHFVFELVTADLRPWNLCVLPSIRLLQHFAVERTAAMFGSFYSSMFLAFESGNVIGLRMMKMMSGGSGSHDEAQLMVTEKVHAMLEANASLWAGGTASSVVDRYREHVAANAKRLSL
jgi:hypothetical protein